jgi:peroxiredoxin Q/BCP
MTDLAPGDAAPDVALPDETGTIHRLTDQRGSWVVLYFYPEDSTSGCTVEACEFRDANVDLADRGAVVWGVSPQGEESKTRFRTEHSLNFPLLIDAGGTAASGYGAWVEKEKDGASIWRTARKTFLIDPSGTIAHVWAQVKPEGHAADVLSTLDRLRPGVGAGAS